jgi:hypothetical protein
MKPRYATVSVLHFPHNNYVNPGKSFTWFTELAAEDILTGFAIVKRPISVLELFMAEVAPLQWTVKLLVVGGLFFQCLLNIFIKPLLRKKSGKDTSDNRSCRSIFLSIVVPNQLEKLITKQLLSSLKSADLLSLYQTAYRPFHSAETAVYFLFCQAFC